LMEVSLPDQASSTGDDEKNRLEIKKLQLEIEAMNRWYSPWLPFAPAIVTAFGVLVGFVVAWQAGVFEARVNRLQTETARLEIRRDQLQAEVDLAPVLALAERIKSAPEVGVGAVEELIVRLGRRSSQQTKDVTYLAGVIASAETTPLGQELLLYCLYQGTRDLEWRRRLFDWANGNLASLTEIEQVRALTLFGEERWEVTDRSAVSSMLLQLPQGAGLTLQAESLFQLGRLHQNAWELRIPQNSKPPFRLLETDPPGFLDATQRARDLVLNDSHDMHVRIRALQAMVEIAPPAALAVAAALLGEATIEAERRSFLFGAALAQGVVAANRAVAFLLLAPVASPTEGRYDDGSMAPWIKWRREHQELVALWLEPGLKTLRAGGSELRQVRGMFKVFDRD
jgi:hypothetical protein